MARLFCLSRGRMTLSAPLVYMHNRPSGVRIMIDIRFLLLLNSITSRTSYSSTISEPSKSWNCSLMDCAARSTSR